MSLIAASLASNISACPIRRQRHRLAPQASYGLKRAGSGFGAILSFGVVSLRRVARRGRLISSAHAGKHAGRLADATPRQGPRSATTGKRAFTARKTALQFAGAQDVVGRRSPFVQTKKRMTINTL
jgi:hypothetical protein